MKYKFNTREELIEMFNSISTPHSHSIQLDGNSAEIEWDGDTPDGWSKYEIKKSKKDGKS
jgi:hypothetical protein